MNAVIRLLLVSLAPSIALNVVSAGTQLMRTNLEVKISPHGELDRAAESNEAAEQVTTNGQKSSHASTDAEYATIDAKAAQSHTQPKQFEGRSSMWEHPLVLGILLGLFLVGPDHLGTLMALSTLTSGADSFKRGFYWGVGHSVGVVLLCPIFLALEYLTSNEVSRQAWGHYGDIFIGTSMIAMGMYFIYYEDSYLEQKADGTYIARGCRCHSNLPSTDVCLPCSPSTTAPIKKKLYGIADVRSPKKSNEYFSTSTWFLVRNTLLGVFQGLCCPLGMTAGTGFLTRVTATASTPMLAAFALEFVLASGIGAGLTALGWGILTMRGSQSVISGRVLYIATCSVLLLFGIVWLTAHSYGVLDRIDFGDRIHHKLMPTAAYAPQA